MTARNPVPSPSSQDWVRLPVWAALRPRKLQGHPELQLLSVYRDHGVVPKDSRDDNHNQAGLDLNVYQVVQPGEVVMNKMKAWQGSIAVSDHLGLVSPDYMVLEVQHPGIHPGFLHYQLRSRPYVAEYRNRAYGVRPSQWRLMYDDFRTIELALPPLPTQKAIAAFLDRKTAAIDALIEKKQKLLDLLAEKRAALINQAVTKGLDPNVPMKDSGIPWIGEIPAHWEVRPSRFLVDESRPIMYGIVLPGPHVEGGVPVVKANNCRPGRLDPALMKRTTPEIESRYARSRLRAGDVVIAIRGSVGSAEIVPATLTDANLTQDAARLAPNRKLMSGWLHLLTQSDWFTRFITPRITGATVKGINIWDLSRVPLPDVPVHEQEQICQAVNSKLQCLDGTQLSKSVDRLQEYRQALITAAVTGQLDIPEEAA